ncbi:MAG: DoxX family protein [Blastocatellia bacterium]
MNHNHTRDYCWLVFFTRVMGGLLFLMAGWHKVFVMSPRAHAAKLFVEPYAQSWIPTFLLWALGFVIPFVELIAGALLVAGWLRRPVAVALGFLLLVVTYGHALNEPFFDVTTHILPRLALLAPVLIFGAGEDRWSVDAWLARRRDRKEPKGD